MDKSLATPILSVNKKTILYRTKKQKCNCQIVVILPLVPIILILSFLMSVCSGSPIPTNNQTNTSATIENPNNSTANQSPTTSPAPQKPGILSRKNLTFGGTSMEPTIHNGEKVTAYPVYRDLQRGDIITFAAPDNSEVIFCKRIVGLPSETIEIKDDQVSINGVVISESYILEPINYVVAPTVIPEKSYYVLGDNRNNSHDSHNFGPIPWTNIQLIVDK